MSIIKGIQNIVEQEVSSLLYDLANKYGFSYEVEYEAFITNFALSNNIPKHKHKKQLKDTDKPNKPKSITWKLPFNGTINSSLCHAICKADGLYIQCKKTHLEESDLCKTCQNYMFKNDKLPYGRIEERAEVGLYDFRFGKYAPLPYSLYMKKHNLSRETVEQYAATLGITLDEQHFIEVEDKDVPKKKGGRKPKSAIQVVDATNDNDNDDDDFNRVFDELVRDVVLDSVFEQPKPEQSEPAKKSKKSKKTEPEQLEEQPAKKSKKSKKTEPEQLEEQPAKKSKKSKKTEPVPEPEPEPAKQPAKQPEQPQPQQVTVKKITYDGVKYLHSPNDNYVYDMNHSFVGIYNPDTKTVEFIQDDDDDDVDDEDEDDEDNDQ